MRTITQYLLPHKIISKIAHICAKCEVPWIKNYLIRYFLARYDVNMHEAIQEDPFAYRSYNAFFTRHLNANSITSPADGVVAQLGKINADKIIQAKGRYFSVQQLIADDALANTFIDGNFATIYLAPKDYHRVHMPFAGQLQTMIYVPGKLFSVNNHAAENIPNLFARNERVVCIFKTEIGPMAVILVGAMIVGGMETVWAGQITPPHAKQISIVDYTKQAPIHLEKGQEMGLFKLGSTVIVLYQPNTVSWEPYLSNNVPVRFGQKIGVIKD